ncbi:hypothetical protein BDA96_06G119100 [Sorghum bicolor]|uniref:Uncharacterized protein n=1 Tax=Sorghum bicolor TaxID=4558 RepID=A0A921QT09_SORBI|nr:hypothetical protein BDA96_06G119100 [Sorghum bicolor]
MLGSGDTPQKAAVSRRLAALLLPIGGGGGTPVGVHAAQRQRPLWKSRQGDVAGRRTARPHHFLLPKIAPAPPLTHHPHSLYTPATPPPGPLRPRRIQIQVRVSRAPPLAACSISPAPLPAPGFHRSGMLYCPVAVGAAPFVASTAHAMHGRSDSTDRACRRRVPLLPRSLLPLTPPRFVLRSFGVWHRLSIPFI